MRIRVVVVVAVLFSMAAGAFAQTSNPVISSFDPKVAIAGTGALDVTVTGLNFGTGASVRVNNSFRDTTRISNTQLRFRLEPGDTSTARTLQISVISGSRFSPNTPFQVLPNDPQVTSITPNAVAVNSPDTTIRVVGNNFAPTAVVLVDNVVVATTYIDYQNLDAVVPASRMRTGGTANITVRNPNNNQPSFPPAQLTISAQPITPVLTALDPNRVTEDGPSFTLRLLGRNFDTRSRVFLDNTERPIDFVSSQEIRVNVLASVISAPKTINVTVLNPGNLRSNALPLIVESRNLPVIDSLVPNTVRANSGTATITINGQRFTENSVVRINGIGRSPEFVSSTRLRLTLNATDLNQPGEKSITVVNGGTGGGESNAEILYVVDQNAPLVTRTNPASLSVATTELNVLVIGSGFDDNDVVLVNGAPRQTTFASATQLAFALLPSDVSAAGVLLISVRNQAGEVSAPVELRVVEGQVPVIESFSPATGEAGASALALTINGRNFSTASIVRFRGQIVTAVQFVSDRQIIVNLTAGNLATPGVVEVTVENPGGLVSEPEFFELIGIPPVITSIDPTSIAAGEFGTSINVTGTNFSSTSVISIDGKPLPTSFNSGSGTLTATLTTADLASPRAAKITVTDRNLTSAAFTLEILRPAISSLTPGSVLVGSSDVTIIVRGSGFLPTSRVEFLGERETQYISATELRALIPAVSLTQPGEFAVTVRNGASAQSTPFFLEVVLPGDPGITEVTPGAIFAGTGNTQITVRGRNFTGDARVRVNGQERETIYVSSTELRATLLASDLTNPGTLVITVTNPTGQPSIGFNFPVTQPGRGRRRAAGR
ncbi:MAG TPA: IPT/TIG domain-containing protein [Thermoanaerobaculia bacterium]|jgi:hypothetical protein